MLVWGVLMNNRRKIPVLALAALAAVSYGLLAVGLEGQFVLAGVLSASIGLLGRLSDTSKHHEEPTGIRRFVMVLLTGVAAMGAVALLDKAEAFRVIAAVIVVALIALPRLSRWLGSNLPPAQPSESGAGAGGIGDL